MSEQILSQEEIDALLTSMDKGEVDLGHGKEGEIEVETYDLTSQNIMLHDQFHALEEVIDKFKKLLRNSISSLLQKSVEIKTAATEMVKFGEFIQGVSSPASFTVFNMEPLTGSALLAIEPTLGFYVIDCMFGGEGKPLGTNREFSAIEQRIIKKFVNGILENFEEAWALIYQARVLLRKSETRAEFVHLYSPNDLAIIMVFSVNADEFSGNMHFCIPYFMLEPIKDKLSAIYLTDSGVETKWNSHIRKLINEVPVEMIAELGKSKGITARDLLGLKVGDMLRLNTGVHDPIAVTIEGIPKYLGFPGVVNGNRAVQIMKLLQHDGDGGEDHGNP